MSDYSRNAGRQGGQAYRKYRAPEHREPRVINTTQDLIELDELEHPGSLYDHEPRWARVDAARDRRRAERMAAENSRPHQPHVLSVLPVDRKAA